MQYPTHRIYGIQPFQHIALSSTQLYPAPSFTQHIAFPGTQPYSTEPFKHRAFPAHSISSTQQFQNKRFVLIVFVCANPRNYILILSLFSASQYYSVLSHTRLFTTTNHLFQASSSAILFLNIHPARLFSSISFFSMKTPTLSDS